MDTSTSSNGALVIPGLITSDTSYYYSWSKTVTLTYNANEGTGAPSAQSGTSYLNYEGTQTAATITISSTKPTRTGYTFNGWYTATSGGTKLGTTYSIKTNTTVYSQWNANTYTIIYDGNGATSGTTVNSSHTYDISQKLNKNNYVKNGYIFRGWSTIKNGSVIYLDEENIINLSTTNLSTITLYAVWTEPRIITFKINSVEFKCKEGMTWTEFCNDSTFNPDSRFFCYKNEVCDKTTFHPPAQGGSIFGWDSIIGVYPNNIIVENREYKVG